VGGQSRKRGGRHRSATSSKQRRRTSNGSTDTGTAARAARRSRGRFGSCVCSGWGEARRRVCPERRRGWRMHHQNIWWLRVRMDGARRDGACRLDGGRQRRKRHATRRRTRVVVGRVSASGGAGSGQCRLRVGAGGGGELSAARAAALVVAGGVRWVGRMWRGMGGSGGRRVRCGTASSGTCAPDPDHTRTDNKTSEQAQNTKISQRL
jgi:hypothetical protein